MPNITVDEGKRRIETVVKAEKERFFALSDAIWNYAELGLEEIESAATLADTLEAEGFAVTRGVAGMPTAFTAEWESGGNGPAIGFLLEYDALAGLSQKRGIPQKRPVVAGAPGHGCGHNTMGPMQSLAAVAVKRLMTEANIPGRLMMFGSPAEEMLVSRPFMIRAGLFDTIDIVLDCHGANNFGTEYGLQNNALISFVADYHGKSAHAGKDPWRGRSAADGIELMHAATERMREHLPPTARIHWATLEAGEAPNVIPDYARTWYYLRGQDDDMEAMYRWVLDCARGAALMTETTHEIQVLAACRQRYLNRALAEALFQNIRRTGKPEYTAAENDFIRCLQNETGAPAVGMEYPIQLLTPETKTIDGSSTDVGDVTLRAPTITLKYPVFAPGTPLHHWSVASVGATSVAHKGIEAGAKAQAMTALDLLIDPDLSAKAKAEFSTLKKTRPYQSLLPEDATPPLGWNTAQMNRWRAALKSAQSP